MVTSFRVPFVTTALLTLSLGAAGAAAPTIQELPHSRVVTYLNGQPSWFVCDGIDTPTVSVLGWPDASGRSRLTTYQKSSSGTYSFQNYRVGGGDPGAGQIHYPLTLAKGSTTKSGVPYNVASFNTGVLDHPEEALTPPILGVTSAESEGQCRWVLNTRLLGFSNRRSVQITQAPGGALTYQTWNFADAANSRAVNPDGVQRSTVPSLSISGGTRLINNTQESFVFQNAGYTYTVRVARQGQPGAASITVSKGGKVLQTEPLTGYTYAVMK
ncbi:hypothetical protein MF271_12425 [Deinococcus sp. KNUC1210]|uniref:hypothetical protein n=1 Tax=Deinococcus sp. KNUC1210 TaxID=2917691 RepID=UPI001EF05811|nr:hypothetical protein [Deinococcus sp. KNUC1210]ULH14787.1 hypothetical protein MF271_12425 [Deinococcus sp. KNUC1210]